jgi:hypothetical protein
MPIWDVAWQAFNIRSASSWWGSRRRAKRNCVRSNGRSNLRGDSAPWSVHGFSTTSAGLNGSSPENSPRYGVRAWIWGIWGLLLVVPIRAAFSAARSVHM